ncbi:MAG: hypothetical protein LBI03_02365, partial [Clostridiales bacterium]|nr:hypothetical protein [Clostridiales bacterium]
MKNFYRKRCKRVFKFNILPLLLAMIMTVGIFLPCSNYVYASEDIDDIVIGDDADTEISDEPSTLDYQEYTALTYTDSSMDNLSDDVSVYLMGELPVGGYAIAYPLDLPIQTDISDCLFFTYDITVYNSDGTPFEPDDPIKVSIVLPDLPYDIQDCSLSLVYIPENGEPEMLDTPVTILDGEVTFDVEHFSAYSVVVTGATKNGAGEVVAVKVDDKVVGNLGNDSNPNVNVNAISTYFGEVHSFTFAIFPTTVTPNLTLTELYQGPDMSSLGNNLIPSPVDAPFSETFSFTDDNVVVAKYTVVSTSGTKNIVLSINITVTNPDTDLGIQNTIAQDGLLDAIMDTNNV